MQGNSELFQAMLEASRIARGLGEELFWIVGLNDLFRRCVEPELRSIQFLAEKSKL